MNLNNIASFFIASISIVVVLIAGKSLLIPFVFALLLWILVREIKTIMDKVGFIRRRFPSWLKSLITSAFILSVLGLISKVLLLSMTSLAKSYKDYQSNIEIISEKINSSLNLNVTDLIAKQSIDFDFGKILGSILNSISELVGSTFMILIYVLFIFLEESNFQKKLKLVFTKENQFDQVSNILDRIEHSVTNYLGLKVLVSLTTGLLSYTVLLLIGIDSPVFWAFLIFILNFIPTIGSLIATAFPALFSILQFGEFTPALMILLFVGSIQVIVGNIIEPKLMGNSLNISSLVAILALSFWGAVWGIIGMILSIPITVITVIIFSQFDQTKSVALMLSEKGILNEK